MAKKRAEGFPGRERWGAGRGKAVWGLMGTFGKKLWVRVNLTSHSWHSWELSNFSRRVTATKRGKKKKMMV